MPFLYTMSTPIQFDYKRTRDDFQILLPLNEDVVDHFLTWLYCTDLAVFSRCSRQSLFFALQRAERQLCSLGKGYGGTHHETLKCLLGSGTIATVPSSLFLLAAHERRISLDDVVVNQDRDAVSKIRSLIDAGEDVNAPDDKGRTALIIAQYYGNRHTASIIKSLIDAGAEVNAQDKDGSTALMKAAWFGGSHSKKMIKALTDAGANLDQHDNDGNTALKIAAKVNNAKAMRTLIKAGVNVNHTTFVLMHPKNIDYIFVLHHGLNHPRTRKRRVRDGETALMIIAREGGRQVEAMIHMLIEAGADINAQNYEGYTALMLAVKSKGRNAKETMRALIKAGADVNKQKYNNRKMTTTLMITILNMSGNIVDLVSSLIAAGSDVNAKDKQGKTPLIYAARFGGRHAEATMRVLIDAGADVNAMDEKGKTVLEYAAQWRGEHAVAIIRLLVARGVTIPLYSDMLPKIPSECVEYFQGAQNWTALHRAADARDAEAICECLHQGTMRTETAVDSTYPDMRTALEIAGSDSYPTAQPVCKDCLALLQPSLVKSVVAGSRGGGGGGGQP